MIIGITGTLGAGKGAVVEYLVKEKGFYHSSARDLFAEGMEKEGTPINRDNMIVFANNLRKTHGPDYVFEELFKRASTHGEHAVIESLRTIGEAEALKRHEGACLIAVDADQALRFERIHGRKSALDEVTFDEFKRQEETEMHSDEPHKQNIQGVIERADFRIMNNGTLEELHAEIERVLTECGG